MNFLKLLQFCFLISVCGLQELSADDFKDSYFSTDLYFSCIDRANSSSFEFSVSPLSIESSTIRIRFNGLHCDGVFSPLEYSNKPYSLRNFDMVSREGGYFFEDCTISAIRIETILDTRFATRDMPVGTWATMLLKVESQGKARDLVCGASPNYELTRSSPLPKEAGLKPLGIIPLDLENTQPAAPMLLFSEPSRSGHRLVAHQPNDIFKIDLDNLTSESHQLDLTGTPSFNGTGEILPLQENSKAEWLILTLTRFAIFLDKDLNEIERLDFDKIAPTKSTFLRNKTCPATPLKNLLLLEAQEIQPGTIRISLSSNEVPCLRRLVLKKDSRSSSGYSLAEVRDYSVRQRKLRSYAWDKNDNTWIVEKSANGKLNLKVYDREDTQLDELTIASNLKDPILERFKDNLIVRNTLGSHNPILVTLSGQNEIESRALSDFPIYDFAIPNPGTFIGRIESSPSTFRIVEDRSSEKPKPLDIILSDLSSEDSPSSLVKNFTISNDKFTGVGTNLVGYFIDGESYKFMDLVDVLPLKEIQKSWYSIGGVYYLSDGYWAIPMITGDLLIVSSK